MKSTTLRKLTLPLAAIALVTGIAGAQSINSTTSTGAAKMGMPAKHAAFQATLSADQKVAMEKAHTLMEAGDKTGAEAIIKAAGITMPARGEGHRGGAMPNLTEAQKTELKTKRDAFVASLTVEQKAAFAQLMYR